jgi:hypothetical protein
MIDDLDETIKKLLTRELPIKNGEVEISFETPNREWAAGRVKPTINFYLYQIAENLKLRQTEWKVEKNNGQSTKRRPPKRMNLTYMITTWAGDVEDEHRLLWRVMAVLAKFPKLPEDLLQGDLKDTEVDIKASFPPEDEILNPTDLWNVLSNDIRPSIHYRVVLPLDVFKRFTGPLVLKKIIKVEQGLEGEGPFEEIVQEGKKKK